MKQYSDEFLREHVTIAEFPLHNSEGEVSGKAAILQCLYDNPVDVLNCAVSKYVGDEKYNEFIDIRMDNPWQRIVISDCLNWEQLDWMDFEEYQKDGGKSYKRNQIISQILKQNEHPNSN